MTKKKFVTDFSGNIYLSTDKLPAIMKEYFTNEQMLQTLQKSTKEATDKYSQSISPTLADTQVENRARVFEKHLPPSNTTPQP